MTITKITVGGATITIDAMGEPVMLMFDGFVECPSGDEYPSVAIALPLHDFDLFFDTLRQIHEAIHKEDAT